MRDQVKETCGPCHCLLIGEEGEKFNFLKPNKLALCLSHPLERPCLLISDDEAGSEAHRKTFLLHAQRL